MNYTWCKPGIFFMLENICQKYVDIINYIL